MPDNPYLCPTCGADGQSYGWYSAYVRYACTKDPHHPSWTVVRHA